MAAIPDRRGISVSLTPDLRAGLDEIKRRTGQGPVDYIRGAINRALVADLGPDWLASLERWRAEQEQQGREQ